MQHTYTLADKAFLDLFPRPERSTVANVFLNAIRQDGSDTPGRILNSVRDNIAERLRRSEDYARRYHDSDWGKREAEQIVKWQRWGVTLQLDFDKAMTYAEWCIWYEHLPRMEREKAKAEQRGQSMSDAPATDPQRRYLLALGYDGAHFDSWETLTKGQASDLITELKARRQQP